MTPRSLQGPAFWFAPSCGCGPAPMAQGTERGKEPQGPAPEGHSERHMATVGAQHVTQGARQAQPVPLPHGSGQHGSPPVKRQAPRAQGARSSLRPHSGQVPRPARSSHGGAGGALHQNKAPQAPRLRPLPLLPLPWSGGQGTLVFPSLRSLQPRAEQLTGREGHWAGGRPGGPGTY